MAHISKFFLIFFSLMIALSLPVWYYNRLDTQAEEQNQIIQEYMTAATYDAAQSAIIDESTAFSTATKRHIVLESFFESLAASFSMMNAGTQHAILSSHVPFVALIDNDGVYINYEQDFYSWARQLNPADPNSQPAPDVKWGTSFLGEFKTTPIYTYTENYGAFTVQFFLDDTVKIFYLGQEAFKGKNGKNYTFSGDYARVCKKLTDSQKSQLPFMATRELFREEKNHVITNCVVNHVRYYINQSINNSEEYAYEDYNQHGAQYQFMIPLEGNSNSGWARSLQGPTIIAFYEGQQNSLERTYVAQYALAGSEIAEEEKYFITKKVVGGETCYFYHTDNCSQLTAEDKKKFYTSMEKCAARGASPCTDCIR